MCRNINIMLQIRGNSEWVVIKAIDYLYEKNL